MTAVRRDTMPSNRQWSMANGSNGPVDPALGKTRLSETLPGIPSCTWSVLADNENTLGQFWDRLRDRLLSDEVNLTS